MITKTYYIDGNIPNNRKELRKIRQMIPCRYSSKPVEMGYLECTFTIQNEDVKRLEKCLAPLV